GRLSCLGETTFDPHLFCPWSPDIVCLGCERILHRNHPDTCLPLASARRHPPLRADAYSRALVPLAVTMGFQIRIPAGSELCPAVSSDDGLRHQDVTLSCVDRRSKH